MFPLVLISERDWLYREKCKHVKDLRGNRVKEVKDVPHGKICLPLYLSHLQHMHPMYSLAVCSVFQFADKLT